jgi:hypothetical protein
MRPRFTIRDLLWLTRITSAALIIAATSSAFYAIAADPPAAQTGILKGRFIYNGSAPEPAVVVPKINPQVFGKYRIIDESLLVPRMLGVQNIFIWVQSKDIPVPAPGKLDPVTVEFKEGRFAPHALAFQVPRELVLKNGDDSVACNFRGNLSESPAFNLMLPMQQRQRQLLIMDPERAPQPLESNLYPWVESWILPLGHPYFAVTDEGGQFKIENLPPGKWEFQVWHERNGFLETAEWKRGRFTLEIKPGENDLGVIKIDPKLLEKK